jgi:regulator of replication initiation timing
MYAKITTIVISFGAGVGGTMVAYNKWIIDRYDERVQSVETVKEFRQLQQSFDTVIDSLSNLSEEVRSIKPHLNSVDTRIDRLIISNENLREYLLNRALDKDEVLEIIKIWDDNEKKKRLSETP